MKFSTSRVKHSEQAQDDYRGELLKEIERKAWQVLHAKSGIARKRSWSPIALTWS
jgi:hypothetical protein